MSTRDLIRAEIESIPDDKLAGLHDLIRRFRESHPGPPGESIMAKLRSVRIDAPADFAANLMAVR